MKDLFRLADELVQSIQVLDRDGADEEALKAAKAQRLPGMNISGIKQAELENCRRTWTCRKMCKRFIFIGRPLLEPLLAGQPNQGAAKKT